MPTNKRTDSGSRTKSSNKRTNLKLLLKSAGSVDGGGEDNCNEDFSRSNVKGTLEVESKTETVIHGILLTVHGEVSTEITRSTSSGQSNNGNQRYFSSIFVQSTYILGNGHQTIKLSEGKRSLPFTISLPPHLPSSYEGIYGGIKYLLTAQIIHSENERKSDNNNKICLPLQVQRLLDLSDGSAYGHSISFPSSIERPQKSFLVPNNSQQVKFVFKIQKTGFAAGETIPFVLDLQNPERKGLTMSVTFLKRTLYGDMKKSDEEVFDELAEVSTTTATEDLKNKKTVTWIGSLHVPQNVIPTHSVVASATKKKIILSHQYLLRIQLLSSSNSPISGDMPIVIGTTKYESRPRRSKDHCCYIGSRTFSAITNSSTTSARDNLLLGGHLISQPARTTTTPRRQSNSVPPSYSQAMFNAERRPSLETLPPPYEEVIAMASRALSKETRHLMG